MYTQLGYSAPLSGGAPEGTKEIYFVVMDRGVFRSVPPMSHFEIRALIFDSLTSGAYCAQAGRCQFGQVKREEQAAHLETYKAILGPAMRAGL